MIAAVKLFSIPNRERSDCRANIRKIKFIHMGTINNSAKIAYLLKGDDAKIYAMGYAISNQIAVASNDVPNVFKSAV